MVVLVQTGIHDMIELYVCSNPLAGDALTSRLLGLLTTWVVPFHIGIAQVLRAESCVKMKVGEEKDLSTPGHYLQQEIFSS
jgi:hypothetical protein